MYTKSCRSCIFTAESRALRAQAAFELCDWIRLADHPLHVTELKRLASIVSRLHPRAMSVLFQNLGPHQGSVWDYEVLDPTEVSGYVLSFAIESGTNMRHSVHFDWLFICATPAIIEDADRRDTLITKLFDSSSVSGIYVERAIRLIAHSLSSCEGFPTLQRSLLLLAAGISQRTRSMLPSSEIARLKSFLFAGSYIFRSMCLSTSLDAGVQEGQPCVLWFKLSLIFTPGLQQVVDACLDPVSDDDKKFAGSFSNFWAEPLKAALVTQSNLSVGSWSWI